MKGVGYFVVTVVVAVYSAILNGWGLAKLWAWFFVTTFGLPALTIPAAIGVGLVVGYLTHQTDKSENEDSFGVTLLKGAITSTFKPLIAVGVGAIVRCWI